jgi:type I restriction enzyme R subunit
MVRLCIGGRGGYGKAMVVSIDKKTAVRMYIKVKAEWDRYLGKLRMDLSRTSDEYERAKIEEKLSQHENVDMAVMVSQSQNEISDLEPFEIDMRPLRDRIIKGNLEEEFKKPDSNLRIVFVCAMWMTGFDVPNLSTLYLDKPLKNHTLMQAIARANRVSPGKKNGLIVDYIGVFRNIEKALSIYASNIGGDDEVIRSKDELVGELEDALTVGKKFLYDVKVDLEKIITDPAEEKLLLIEHAANTIVSDQSKKKKFLYLASNVHTFPTV